MKTILTFLKAIYNCAVQKSFHRSGLVFGMIVATIAFAPTVSATQDNQIDNGELFLGNTITVSCGAVIDQPFTTVRFDSDLYCYEAPALTIAAYGVTVDLNGVIRLL